MGGGGKHRGRGQGGTSSRELPYKLQGRVSDAVPLFLGLMLR